jgi:hypothetical protein
VPSVSTQRCSNSVALQLKVIPGMVIQLHFHGTAGIIVDLFSEGGVVEELQKVCSLAIVVVYSVMKLICLHVSWQLKR